MTEGTGADLAGVFELLLPHLDERQPRLVLGAAARVRRHGGVRLVAEAAGVATSTVSRGLRELNLIFIVDGRSALRVTRRVWRFPPVCGGVLSYGCSICGGVLGRGGRVSAQPWDGLPSRGCCETLAGPCGRQLVGR